MTASADLTKRAFRVMSGGVNSPVRAFRSIDHAPVYGDRGDGAWVWDADGHRRLDLICSWGANILGHGAQEVAGAVIEQAARGLGFGTSTAAEVALAEELTDMLAPMDVVRLVCSGTEATMSALRLARAVTARDVLVKFDGGYHGHADSFLVAAGSGPLTLGTPDSAGVPRTLAELTRSLPYGDIEALERAFQHDGDRIAAVVVEPIAGNAGMIIPDGAFLEAIARLTKTHGALAIHDEVMTGFRVSRTGAYGRFGVAPDLFTLGKVIGGGLPLAAYGGRRDLMARLAPDGDVYQAGTLSGSPVAVAAGRAVVASLNDDLYASLNHARSVIQDVLTSTAASKGFPLCVVGAGGMFGVWCAEHAPRHLAEAQATDVAAYKRLANACLDGGILVPPSAFESWFLTRAHASPAVLDEACELLRQAVLSV